jgi:hypothetical protein
MSTAAWVALVIPLVLFPVVFFLVSRRARSEASDGRRRADRKPPTGAS